MFWAFVMTVSYGIAVWIVVASDSKTIRVAAMVVWALVGLAIGRFGWRIFG